MRRGILAGILVTGLMITVALVTVVQPAQAFQGHIKKIKSDCTNVQVEATLIFDKEDVDGKDMFRMEIYDVETDKHLANFTELISQDQSPFYWQSHRIDAITTTWHYRIELWDVDQYGGKLRKVDEAFYECHNHVSWRPLDHATPRPIDPTPGLETCRAWMNFNTTNTAPEPGAVVVVWAHGTEYTDQQYHLATYPVNTGDYLDWYSDFLSVPCGVYIKLYYQPDSSKQIYFMPSQVYPGHYGTSATHDNWSPTYHTFFPLDGAIKPTSTPFPDQ